MKKHGRNDSSSGASNVVVEKPHSLLMKLRALYLKTALSSSSQSGRKVLLQSDNEDGYQTTNKARRPIKQKSICQLTYKDAP